MKVCLSCAVLSWLFAAALVLIVDYAIGRPTDLLRCAEVGLFAMTVSGLPCVLSGVARAES